MSRVSDNTLYDINIAVNWLAMGDLHVDCEYLLSLWNITVDLAYSVKRDFAGNSKSELTSLIYDKLFWGNNFPAVRGDGEIFIPQWNHEETREIQKVVADSINIIKSIFLQM